MLAVHPEDRGRKRMGNLANRRLGARGQLLRYTGVGAAAFLVDMAVLLVLVEVGVHYLPANVAAFALANLFNFLAAQVYVFRNGSRVESLWTAYLAVLSISVAGLGLNTLLLYAAVELAAMSLVPAKVAATLVVLLWNFDARRRWVYR